MLFFPEFHVTMDGEERVPCTHKSYIISTWCVCCTIVLVFHMTSMMFCRNDTGGDLGTSWIVLLMLTFCSVAFHGDYFLIFPITATY